MLWTITIILVILWILGLVTSYTLGGWIHLLLVLAIIVLIFNLLSGRSRHLTRHRANVPRICAHEKGEWV